MFTPTEYVLVIADADGFERCYFDMTLKHANEVARLLPREGGAVYVAKVRRNAKRAPDMRAQGEMAGQERWYDALETLDGNLIRYL